MIILRWKVFMEHLSRNLYDRIGFETDQKLNESTLDYVYGYYNHIRPHSSNGYMTPFEKRYSNQ